MTIARKDLTHTYSLRSVQGHNRHFCMTLLIISRKHMEEDEGGHMVSLVIASSSLELYNSNHGSKSPSNIPLKN